MTDFRHVIDALSLIVDSRAEKKKVKKCVYDHFLESLKLIFVVVFCL